MTNSVLEHINLTVRDIDKSAATICELFGWHIRWKGDAIDGGKSIHVGSQDCYLALYCPSTTPSSAVDTYHMQGGLNHIAIVVDDLDDVEARVKAAGFQPHSHANYEPGRRFYYRDADNVEFEIVSYV